MLSLYKLLVIDIETLGLPPTVQSPAPPVVIQIGAALLTQRGGEAFAASITVEDQLIKGSTIDPKTLDWWRSDINRHRTYNKIVSAKKKLSLQEGIHALSKWYTDTTGFEITDPELSVWNRHTHFDQAILNSVATLPWNPKRVFDISTIDHIFPKVERKKMTHDAKEDCLQDLALLCEYIPFLVNSAQEREA